MAGHSKWANIRHRKAAVDKKRGKIWSKCSRAIMAAARVGGGSPESNLALRYAIDEARYANMPKDTIQRAIEKGAGAAGGDNFENVRYEGYGPAGSAIIVEALTDNRTRTAGDVRAAFAKYGGNLGATNCVAYAFDSRGQIIIEASAADEDTIMSVAIEAGALDVQPPEGDDGAWVVLCEPPDFLGVRGAVESAGIAVLGAGIVMLPQSGVSLSGEDAERLTRLVDLLEDNDDVQKVYTNADMVG